MTGFDFSNHTRNDANNGTSHGVEAPDLVQIHTDALGFQAIAGDARVQLLSTPWPENNLPPPTSSLLGIASRRGLLAAAGPDMVIVASTEAVRKAFEAPGDTIKPFQAPLQLPMPFRISQVAFSSDEQYLILTAESGGGLAVYEVQALLNGVIDSAFQIPTNSEAIRALVPNPAVDRAELIAVVTEKGKLLVANLKQKDFTLGANGPVMKENVSCVSWSRLGKQLVAGTWNGLAYQMTPEGVGKAEIPRPPRILESPLGDFFVSEILWLENTVFLIVYTPMEHKKKTSPYSEFYIVTKQDAAAQKTPQAGPPTYFFQRIQEPTGPFGLGRSTHPHHYMLRLKDFPPNLQDLIVVASSSSSELGLLSRSAVPLDRDKPITNVFTYTQPTEDARRAALPVGATGPDTAAIGMAMDLSATNGVPRPILFNDEIAESAGPMPGVMILNHEGVVVSWWLVYNESVIHKTIYPGIASLHGAQEQQQQQPTFGSQTTQSPFGPVSTFGTPSFGAPGTGVGQKTSWGAAASAQPTFGAPAFGAPSLSATRANPFQAASGFSSAPAFGQPAFSGAPAATGRKTHVWGAPSTGLLDAVPASGGFASFANKGGFVAAAAAAAVPSTTSSTSGGFASFADNGGFRSAPSGGLFGSNSASNVSAFSGGSTAFGQPEEKPSVFGQSAPAASDSMDVTNDVTFGSGASFGGSNNDTSSTSFGTTEKKLGSLFGTRPVNATTGSSADQPNPFAQDSSSTPFGGAGGQVNATTGTPADKSATIGSILGVGSSTSPFGGLKAAGAINTSGSMFGNFGTPAKSNSSEPVMTTPAAAESDDPLPPDFTTLLADAPSSSTSSVPDKPAASDAPLLQDMSVLQKAEPTDAPLPPDFFTKPTPKDDKTTDAPLPPEFFTKPTPKDDKTTDAPLPPDFFTKLTLKDDKSDEVPALAEDSDGFNVHGTGDETYSLHTDDEDDEGDDEGGFSDEGSGEDVTKDLSPVSDSNDNGVTPESSFAGAKKGPASLFSSVDKPSQSSSGLLFGEVPKFPPPTEAVPVSPRSPSPVRSAVPGRMKPETLRSASTPPAAFRRSTSTAPKAASSHPVPAATFSGNQVTAGKARRAKAKAEKEAREAEEAQATIDHDDILAQKQLSGEIVPTTTLNEFVAHQDYIIPAQRTGIPAQVENVYRDINSMIDTLGINARNLKAFTLGHSNGQKAAGRTKDDLEDDVNDWVLGEIESLTSIIERDLTKELEDNRIKDVKDKLQECSHLRAQASKLRQVHEDTKELVFQRADPDAREAMLAADLNADQRILQSAVRQNFQNFWDKAIEAEQALTVLKAKLVSKGVKANINGGGVPTIEAVMRTISKMTAMAEKKSGDVDVLENEIAKLSLGASMGSETREGSPFAPGIRTSPLSQLALRGSTATRTPLRSSMKNSPGSRSSGIYQSPNSIHSTTPTPQNRNLGISTSIFSRSRGSLASSMGSSIHGSPAKLNMEALPKEVLQRARDKMHRKKTVAEALRTAVGRVAPRVVNIDSYIFD